LLPVEVEDDAENVVLEVELSVAVAVLVNIPVPVLVVCPDADVMPVNVPVVEIVFV
jgi:hypothetical protein